MVRTTPFTFFGLSNLVKHHQLNYVAAELRVFGVQLGLRQTQAIIKMKMIRRGKVSPAILLLSSKLLLSSNEAGGTFPLLLVFVLFRAASWLSFWCSTRPSADTGTK